jgi:hypothetical protein
MTTISQLYDIFLSKISDYTLLSDMITEEEIDEQLFGYLETAIAIFYKCKTRLDILEEIDGKVFGYVDESGTTIHTTLSPFEIQILVSLMLVEYITPQLLSSENLKQSLSDKDFKIYSQANQLREIRLLMESLERKAKKMITEYTFFDLGKEDAQ